MEYSSQQTEKNAYMLLTQTMTGCLEVAHRILHVSERQVRSGQFRLSYMILYTQLNTGMLAFNTTSIEETGLPIHPA